MLFPYIRCEAEIRISLVCVIFSSHNGKAHTSVLAARDCQQSRGGPCPLHQQQTTQPGEISCWPSAANFRLPVSPAAPNSWQPLLPPVVGPQVLSQFLSEVAALPKVSCIQPKVLLGLANVSSLLREVLIVLQAALGSIYVFLFLQNVVPEIHSWILQDESPKM